MSLGSHKSSFRSSSGSGGGNDSMRDVLAKKESKHGALDSYSRGSHHSLTDSTPEDESEHKASGARVHGDDTGDGDPQTGPFDEEEYLKWRTEVRRSIT